MVAVNRTRLPEPLGSRLEARAKSNGRTVDKEVRSILEEALTGDGTDAGQSGCDLAVIFREHFAPLGGVDLRLPPRDAARDVEGREGGA